MPSIINALTASGGGVAITGDATGNLALQTAGNTAVTIDTSQNVGVGTTTINDRLVVQSSSAEQGITIRGDGLDAIKIGMVNPSVSNDGVIGMKINNALRFITNNTERMRIASDGTLQVKSSTTTAPWDATSGNYVWVGGTYPIGGANSDIIAIFNRHTNNGTVVEIKKGTSLLGTISHNGTNTAYNTSSDYRLKENIAPMQNALNLVQQLKPCTYTWKANGSNGQGFIAHELQECLPDAVTGEKDAVDADGKIIPQQIDTSFLVATLTAAIQELKAELDATKAEVQALKGVK